jgi:hypothetical protein
MAFGALKGTFEAAATSPGTGFAATGSIAVSVGDLVVVALGSRGTGGNPITFTDNLGHNYTEETNSDATSRCIYPAWVRITTAGTLTSVSFSQTSDAGDKAMVVGVFEGPFDATDPLDVVLPGNTADTAEPWPCPATGTLAQADELIIGMIVHGNGIVEGQYTATAPFSMVEQESSNGTSANSCAIGMCYQVVSATTTQTPQFEQNTASSTQGTSRYTLSFKKGDLTQALTPSLVTNSQTYHTPTVTPGAVDVSPSALITDGDTVFAAAVAQSSPLTQDAIFVDGETVFAATITTLATILPDLVSDADTVFSATVTPGAVDLTPSLVSDADTVFSATITATAALLPSLVSDDDTYYTHVLDQEAGATDLQPSLVTDGDTVYGGVDIRTAARASG